jgi:isochorismate hydrolase
MHEKERVLRQAQILARGLALLNVPTVVTEQYRQGLGPTVPELARLVADFAPIEKLAFSAWAAEGVLSAARVRGAAQVILCGIETHVCVLQTCLDLRTEGLEVFVVADAVSSRTSENHCLGLERMRQAGAVIASTEMILFELLERAGTEEFKKVLPLVK